MSFGWISVDRGDASRVSPPLKATPGFNVAPSLSRARARRDYIDRKTSALRDIFINHEISKRKKKFIIANWDSKWTQQMETGEKQLAIFIIL